MPIDPVKLALEEIKTVERMLGEIRATAHLNRQHAETINILEVWLGDLQATLPDLQPTSVIGSAELIEAALDNLPAMLAHLAPQLKAIAARMAEGERRQGDIIWLRAVVKSLPTTPGIASIRRLLENAIAGATKPILIHRTADKSLLGNTHNILV